MTNNNQDNLILDIGCGSNKIKKPDAIGVDILNLPGVDVVCDFAHKLPFEDNKALEIHCYHVLEHLQHPEILLTEMYRVAKDGCLIYIRTPHFTGTAAWCDPTHVRAFSLGFFDNFAKGVWDYIGKVDLTIVKKVIRWGGNYPVEKWYPRYGFTSNFMKPFLWVQYYVFLFLCTNLPSYLAERFSYLIGGCDEIEVIYRVNKKS